MFRFPILSAPPPQTDLWFSKPLQGDDEITKLEQAIKEKFESIRTETIRPDPIISSYEEHESDEEEIVEGEGEEDDEGVEESVEGIHDLEYQVDFDPLNESRVVVESIDGSNDWS